MRPYKFGTATREQLLDLIRNGQGKMAAARSVGVEYTTVQKAAGWRGAEGGETPYGTAIREAEQERTRRQNEEVVDALFDAAVSGNQRSIEFWLTNREPEHWSKRERVELSGPDGGPIAVSVKDELTALIEASARRLMGEPQELVEVQAIEAPPE